MEIVCHNAVSRWVACSLEHSDHKSADIDDPNLVRESLQSSHHTPEKTSYCKHELPVKVV